MRKLEALALGVGIFLAASWAFIGWTDEGSDRYPGGVVVRDSAGNVLRVTLGHGDIDCRPSYVASADDWVVKALIASEDGTFWTHHGVRPLSIIRAAGQNLLFRRRISGASTITMQAVRLIRPHPKTFWWKWKEAIQALKMERAKTKTWILSQYLNRAPYGSNLVGIEAAAQGWFGRGAKELGLGEAALLAGIVQAPSRFRPDRHLDRAIHRRDYVLGRMRALDLITDEQLAAAKSVVPEVRRAPRPFLHPHFCDWTLAARGIDEAAARAGGDLTTALDADIQQACVGAVDAAARAGGYSVAAAVMRVRDGATVALACSGDYFRDAAGQVNTAAAPRPAGSTLKPFLVALAIERGLVTPETRLADIPRAYSGYRPANFDSNYRGLVTVRDALIQSLNIPFVQLLRETGVDPFATTLHALGFGHIRETEGAAGLGMAIGNVEVTLMELLGAYATIARGGVTARGERVLAPGTSYLISEMLSGDERASAALGHIADVETSRFAWKTGTSSAYRDAWTVAWNPEWVVGVWCGHISGGFGDRTLVGAKAAAPVAWGIARQLYPRNDGPWFVRPGDVEDRRSCSLTGLPAGPDCPATEPGHAVRGYSSPRLCEVHCRDASGHPIVRNDAFLAAFAGRLARAEQLAIVAPEDGATIRLVAGDLNQKVVCRVIGNPEGERLWWFVDGRFVGESTGLAPFAVALRPGSPVITCSTAEGVTATAHLTVEE